MQLKQIVCQFFLILRQELLKHQVYRVKGPVHVA